ncbi:MAG: ATP-dependent helicase HrpB [Kiritimatiellia bacterium]
MDPLSLPIYDIERDIVSELRGANRLILQAPTGSGKSTQVPKMMLKHGLAGEGEIVILQPRRIAARMLARRVAGELGVRLGDEVGYQIRLESVVSVRTRIRYVTEGILLRQMISSPDLRGVAAVIFDEFHERHLFGDISLAQALDLQEKSRPDLRILVMSATLEMVALREYLAPCRVLTSEGRTFPVTIRHAARPVDSRAGVWDAAAEAVQAAYDQGADGDALVFMPGAYEIARTIEAVKHKSCARGAAVLPLHGELPPADQDRAVTPGGARRIIVSTNVAETSLTIDGVRVVVDSGLARIARHDAARGINLLEVEPVSRASADQRAGRAGRTAPGVCYRLWTESEHHKRAPQELPEVRRLDLAEVALTLKAGGVDDLRAFRWLEKPDAVALAQTEELLHDLGATDEHGRITALGRRMLAFPAHPRYARMLIDADSRGCVRQACLIAALTQGRSILIRNPGRDVLARRAETLGEDHTSDFFLLMRAWGFAERSRYATGPCADLGIHAAQARQVGPLYQAFLDIAAREGLVINERAPDDERIRRCILAGFSDHVAMRRDRTSRRCLLARGRAGELSAESVVQDSTLMVSSEVREVENFTGGKGTITLGLVTAIEESWLRDLALGDFHETRTTRYDEPQKRVMCEVRREFRGLALESRLDREVNADEACRILVSMVGKGDLALEKWDDEVDHWIQRVNCLAAWRPDWALPAIGEDDRQTLLEQVVHGCVSKKDVKEAEVWPVVREWLNPAQHALLDRHAPERIELPGGRKVRVQYKAGSPPDISALIQDLYGLAETPRIAGGQVPLRVQILAPSRRPVQVTEDLASFWRDRYPVVKQELQRKYPRHVWK